MNVSFDMIVIGGGPGGYVAAIRSSQLGKKTALVERDKLGGRCLNYACIPAKAVLRSADLYKEVSQVGRFGIEIDNFSLDWKGVCKNRDRVIKTLTGGVGALMKKHGVEVHQASATLKGSGKVSLDSGVELIAKSVILATGSTVRSIPGVEIGGRVRDTADTWLTDELPESLIVIGAGASGVEIASAFGRFGCEITLIEMVDQILPAEDTEIAVIVQSELDKQNVKTLTGVAVDSVTSGADSVEVTVAGEKIVGDYLCIATGRAADIEGLGLSDAGVELDKSGLIDVDEAMRTTSENVYAVGDLVRGPALAHKASDEGVIAAEDAAGLKTDPIDPVYIPRATFCYPQVASFGLTEKQAEQTGKELAIGRFPFSSIGAATVYGDRVGLVKIVADAKLGEILGAHIVGQRAPELIADFVSTRTLEGGVDELARIIHAHPTISEGVMEAARATRGWATNG